MPDTSWLPIYRSYRAGQCFVKCGIFFKFVVPLRLTRTCWNPLVTQIPSPYHLEIPPESFQLNTYKTFENIAVTWTPPAKSRQIDPVRGLYPDLYFTWFWMINVAKLYMYLPAYLPGISIQVCRVCMLNMNARYLMVYPATGLAGQVSVSLNCGIFFKFVVPLRLTRTCWNPLVYTDPWPYHLEIPPESFSLIPIRLFENIAVTWTPPQIKANWPARPISDLYFTWFWLINVAKLYMYLPAYLPGVSIQVCRVCMLNMNARYLMVTHLQGLPGRSVFR